MMVKLCLLSVSLYYGTVLHIFEDPQSLVESSFFQVNIPRFLNESSYVLFRETTSPHFLLGVS